MVDLSDSIILYFRISLHNVADWVPLNTFISSSSNFNSKVISLFVATSTILISLSILFIERFSIICLNGRYRGITTYDIIWSPLFAVVMILIRGSILAKLTPFLCKTTIPISRSSGNMLQTHLIGVAITLNPTNVPVNTAPITAFISVYWDRNAVLNPYFFLVILVVEDTMR